MQLQVLLILSVSLTLRAGCHEQTRMQYVFEIVGVADGKELNAKTEPTGTYEFDNKTFMKFDMSGDVIDRITAAKLR